MKSFSVSRLGPRRLYLALGRRAMSTATTTTTTTAGDDTLGAAVRDVLAQNRNVMNFVHYTPSAVHAQRMQTLRQQAPDVYRLERPQWLNHPRWHENSQMPPFHIHYRVEMQEVLRCLYQACQETTAADEVALLLRRAQTAFAACMRGLHGHVHIEEYACSNRPRGLASGRP